MTTPVASDDIVSGAVQYLMDQPEVVAAVSKYTIGGQVTPGIFGHQLPALIEGTSSTCLLLMNEGGWTTGNMENTLRFPRLTVNIWADPLRDNGRNASDPGEVMRRAFAVYKVVDKFLHRVAGPEVFFGTLRVITSVRATEPIIYMVPDGDGLVRCVINYALSEG